MAHVRVESSDVDFEADPSESIYRAAVRSGYYWPTSCNGAGTCLVCWTLVEDGAEHLSEPGPWERQQIDHLMTFVNHGNKPVRLACQTRPLGDVSVRKTGVERHSERFKHLRRD